jgi:molybdate transport system permease protein
VTTDRAARAIRPPWPVLVLGLFGVAFFALPFVGLVARAPWSSADELLSDESVRTALRLSLVTSVVTTVLAVVIGVPLAWLLARSRLPGRRLVRALCTLSMVLPPVVAGVALLQALGRRGIVGRPLDRAFGIALPFSTAAVVVAQLFVAMPFLVLTVEAALRTLDPGREDAARTLGAGRWYVFRRVTIPAIRPALVSGIVLTWARALGEFGATITFAGSFPGTTRTVPLATYLALENDPDQAILLSLVLVAVSFGVLVGLRERWIGAAFGGVRS